MINYPSDYDTSRKVFLKKFIFFTSILFLFSLFILLSISKINATEILEKRYNEESKTVILQEPSGLKVEVLKAVLDTPLVYKTRGTGYQKVAQITLNAKKDISGAIGNFELHDLTKNGKSIERSVDIKYLKSKECKSFLNGEYEYCEEDWQNFDNTLLSGEEMIIGLFTDVKVGDHVEWIPEIAGVKVFEWAEWEYSESSFPIFGISLAILKNEAIWYSLDLATDIVTEFYENWTYTEINHSVSEVTDPTGMAWDGTNWWVVGASDNAVWKYNPDWTYAGTNIDLSSQTGAKRGIYFKDGFFYLGIDEAENERVAKYYANWTFVETAIDSTAEGTNHAIRTPHFANGFWWVTCGTNCNPVDHGLVYKYYPNGTYTGTNIDLTVQQTNTEGIFYDLDNDAIYVTRDGGVVNRYVGFGENSPPQSTLNYPEDDSILINHSVTFSVTPEDSESSTLSVSIYGNWTGTWELAASNENSLNNTQTDIIVENIPNGVYIWNARVSDGVYSVFSSSNQSLTIDVPPTTRIFNKTNADISTSYDNSGVSIMTLKTVPYANYTFGCNLIGNSSSPTVGIKINVTVPQDPIWFSTSITNPTTGSSAMFVACAGTNNSCNASGKATSTAPTPITINGRLLNGPNPGFLDVTFGSEINDAMVTIMRESNCWIVAEN